MINKDNVLNGAQMLTMMGGIDHPGAKMRVPGKVRDAATGGNRTVDGSGAFLVGELERLDQTSHQPLASVTFHEDLPFRDDVTLGDEWTSFTQETFGTPGGAGTGSTVGQKRSAIGKKSTQLPEMEVDIDKITVPLFAWGEGIAYSLPELESAARVGRRIDQRKLSALDREYQLQCDAQMYIGWQGNSTYGLNNSPLVAATNLPNAAAGGGGPTSRLPASSSPVTFSLNVSSSPLISISNHVLAIFKDRLARPLFHNVRPLREGSVYRAGGITGRGRQFVNRSGFRHSISKGRSP
jgi:hypothetical protein